MAVTRTGTVQINVKVGGTEEAKAAQDAFDKMEQHLGKLGATMAQTSQKMNAWSFGLINNAIGAIPGMVKGAVHGIAELGKELENFDIMSKRFKGSVDDVEQALRFAVDEVVFMQAQFKLANAGLDLSGQAFLELSEGASKLAHALGVDVKEAFESVTQLLVTGSAKQAKVLGLSIDAAKAEGDYARQLGITREQLSELGKHYAHQLAYLDRFREKTEGMAKPVATMKDKWAEFTDSIADSTREMLRWGKESLVAVHGVIKEISGEREAEERRRKAEYEYQQELYRMKRAIAALDGQVPDEAKHRLASMFGGPLGRERLGDTDETARAKAATEGHVGGAAKAKTGTRGTGGAGDGLFGGIESMGLTMANQFDEQTAAIKKQLEAWNAMWAMKTKSAKADNEWFQLLHKNEQTLLKDLQARRKAEEAQQAAYTKSALSNPLRHMIEQHYGLAKAVGISTKELGNFVAAQKAAADDDILGSATSSVLGMASGMWQLADAAIQGQQSFGMAALGMIKAAALQMAGVMTTEALKAAMYAGLESAAGTAALGVTWGIPNPASVAHFTAAGMYGALAVKYGIAAGVTGVGGLALSAGMASMSGGGGSAHGSGPSASSGASSGAVAPRATYGTSKSDDSQRPIYVSLYLTPGDPAATALANRQLEAKIRKAAA